MATRLEKQLDIKVKGSRWYSVNEHLPPPYLMVMMINIKEKAIGFGRHNPKRGWSSFGYYQSTDVEYWAEIPFNLPWQEEEYTENDDETLR